MFNGYGFLYSKNDYYLGTFKNNKSPGEDGLTKEFYVRFWNDCKMKYLECITKGKTEGSLSKSQRTGIIKLLEKKGKSRLELSNWRPITLLNVDYKLLTKTLGARVKSCIGSLVHEDQNGFVPDRNIFFSAHTIRDMLFFL